MVNKSIKWKYNKNLLKEKKSFKIQMLCKFLVHRYVFTSYRLLQFL